jgi:hypothetical protein
MKSALLLAAVLFSACRSTPPPPRAGGPPQLPGGLSVQTQMPGRLILSDRSPWQIQPAGQSASLSWQPGEPISVIRSGHPAWPFLLTSQATGAAALARPSPAF